MLLRLFRRVYIEDRDIRNGMHILQMSWLCRLRKASQRRRNLIGAKFFDLGQ